MRVAIVTTHPPSKGGLNEYAYHLIRFLRQKPTIQEVILLADELPAGQQYVFPEKQTDTHLASIHVEVCWHFDAWNNAPSVRAAVKQINPDVVLFNIEPTTFGQAKTSLALGMTTPALIKSAGYPTIVLLHNVAKTTDDAKMKLSNTSFMKIASRFLSRTDLLAIAIPDGDFSQYKHKDRQIFFVPGIQEAEATSPVNQKQIMTFGEFGTNNQIELLIEAFKRLQNNGRGPLELVIVGNDNPTDTGYLARVKHLYANVPGVHFTGYVPKSDLPEIFHQATVVVLPQVNQTTNTEILQPVGDYGKAVVLPNRKDFVEQITEAGYTGEFFEPANPKSMAAAIGRMIDDPSRQHEIGRQNFVASRGNHISVVADWLSQYFEKVG